MTTSFQPAVINDSVKRGTTYSMTISLTDSQGVPVPITGNSIQQVIKDNVSGNNLASLSVGSGITILDGPGGIFQCRVEFGVTDAWTPTTARHDVEMTFTDTPATKLPVASGTISVVDSVVP